MGPSFDRMRLRSRASGALVVVVGLFLASVLVATPAQATTTCEGQLATVVGTSGDDTLTGTEGPDVIAGLGGNDTITGRGGGDVVCGGDGDDIVYGDIQTLSGGVVASGDDRIFGEGGLDTLHGDFGNVTSLGGAAVVGGSDHIDGGGGSDVIYGAARDVNVTVVGVSIGFGSDTINGGDGADTVYGSSRTATIAGLLVTVGSSDTVIRGGEGADTLYGDFETFTTTVITAVGGWRDVITAGVGDDTVYGDAVTINGVVTLAGSAMDDVIDGGEGSSDTADGGRGTDTCTNVENESNCELDSPPDPGTISCQGEMRIDFSPGLTNTPQELTFTVQRSLDSCVSPTHPQITSGEMETIQFTLVRSCNDLLVPALLSLLIEWNDNTNSLAAYDFTSTYVNGNLVITHLGEVVAGTFAGSDMYGGMVFPADLTACSTPEGITTLEGPLLFNTVPL